MKSVVNKVYTVLANLDNPDFVEALTKWGDRCTAKWDKPEYLENFVITTKR